MRSDVEIRSATDTDLAVLISTFGDEDFFVDRLARQHGGRGILLTAWLHDKPVGDVYLWLEQADEPEVREHLPGVPLLNHVEVHPEHRNRTVGTQLVSTAEKLLAQQGYEQVALAVRIDNLDAHRLYLRLGYETWPHPPVVCMYEVRLADGSRKRCPETCYMMVKPLRDNSA
ncbi:GNAT family N-acetyltransferase [Kibdelosporangium philippinense]|uniref:GNAT family N-acetyltransferase n=1 Tax=Kibdelosporangium philippinense TaxID=211113 RepID=A0ABS8Z9I2_9PSEU|nr:GNAT family N-acetyltransferase [Kibdelosporangium philippinense]MCE7003445.1 GNAT family N-acetyltransferase [Kibdelosporangium philippinense]